MGELLVILAVALLVLGPKRLPDIATGLGKAIREFRKATRDLQDQIEVDDSVRRPIQELRAALRDEPPPPILTPPTGTASTNAPFGPAVASAAGVSAAIASPDAKHSDASAAGPIVSDKIDPAA